MDVIFYAGDDGESALSADKSGEREPAPSELREKLTFVSHAGEEKQFVRGLLTQIEKANVATFFDDDMSVGTSAGNEMVTRAEEADQAVVVLSRSFLTKKWPMKELNIFIEKQVKIYPLYYQITPDELDGILAIYDSQAGDDEDAAFRLKMEEHPAMWRSLMNEIAPRTSSPGSRGLPDPCSWRENLRELRKLTGLRRGDFGNDEAHYMQATARMVSPPVLPDGSASLPEQFVKPPAVDAVILALTGSAVSREAARHVVLSGMGGVGKTLIASAVVRDKTIRRFFGDGVLWINDRPGDSSTERLLLQLDALARQFEEIVLARYPRQGNTVRQFVDKFDTVRKAQDFFRMWRAKHNLKCLLVVDSAWNQRILQAAYAMGFSVLATVRNSTVVPDGQRWCSIPVLPMGEDDSLVILKKYSRASDDVPREWALQVAKDCAFLPQALAIAASTPTVVDAPLSEKAWCDLHTRLVDTARVKHTTTGQSGPLDAIVGVSYEDMGRRQRVHFLKLAVLPNGVSAPLNMLGQLWDEDLGDARVAVRDLVARSLMNVHGDEYLVHDLLLDYAKARIDKALAKDAAVRQAQHLSDLNVLDQYIRQGEFASGGFYSLVGLWGSVVKLDGLLVPKDFYLENLATTTESQEWVHAAHILKLMGDYEGAADILEGLMTLLEGEARLESEDSKSALTSLGYMCMMLGKFDEAAAHLLQMVEICTKGGFRVSADALSILASTFAGQGKFDQAHAMYNSLVQAMEERGQLDDPVFPRILDNLGDLLKNQGKLHEAGLVFDRVISTLKESVGEQHPDYASALHNRAAVFSAENNHPNAIKVYHRALAIRDRALGHHHPETLRTRANLACALGTQEEYEEANAMFEQVTEIIQKTAEIDDLELAYALDLWAITLLAQNKDAEAESTMARAVSIWETHYRGDHPLLLRSILWKAKLLMAKEKFAAAAPFFEEACGMSERLFHDGGKIAAECRRAASMCIARQDGPDVDEGILSTNRADIDDHLPRRAVSLIEEGALDEALPLYEQWFASAPTHLGSKHLDASRELLDRGQAFLEKRDFDNAAPLYRLGVRITDDVFAGRGEDVSTEGWMVKLRLNLSMVLVAKGFCGEAEPVIRKCLADGKDTLEPAMLALLVSNLGFALWGQGRSQESIETYAEAIKARMTVLGPKHPDTLKLIPHVRDLMQKQKHLLRATQAHHSASLLLSQGKLSTAGALFGRVEEMLSSSDQEQHPNYAAVLWNHAALLHTQDKRSEAEGLLERALGILRQALNPHHRMVVSAQQALVSVHEGRHEEAETLLRRCQCGTGEHACDEGSYPRTPKEETLGNGTRTLEDDYEEFTTTLVLLSAPEESDMRAKVLCSRALNLLRREKFDACVADCNEALEISPSDKAFHLRALAKAARGEVNSALEDATQALELDPGDESIQATVASLTTAATN